MNRLENSPKRVVSHRPRQDSRSDRPRRPRIRPAELLIYITRARKPSPPERLGCRAREIITSSNESFSTIESFHEFERSSVVAKEFIHSVTLGPQV